MTTAGWSGRQMSRKAFWVLEWWWCGVWRYTNIEKKYSCWLFPVANSYLSHFGISVLGGAMKGSHSYYEYKWERVDGYRDICYC